MNGRRLFVALCMAWVASAFQLAPKPRAQFCLLRMSQPNFESLALKHQMAQVAEADELRVQQAQKEMEWEAFKHLTMQTLHPRLVKELVRETAKANDGKIPRHSLASQAQSLLRRKNMEEQRIQEEERQRRSQEFSQHRHTLHTFLTKFIPHAFSEMFVEKEVDLPQRSGPNTTPPRMDNITSAQRKTMRLDGDDEDKHIHRRFPLPLTRRTIPIEIEDVDMPNTPSVSPVAGPDLDLVRRVNDHVLMTKLATLALPIPPPVPRSEAWSETSEKSWNKYMRPKYGHTMGEQVEDVESQLLKQEMEELRQVEEERVTHERLLGMHPKPSKYFPEPGLVNGTVATQEPKPESLPYRNIPVRVRGFRR